MMEIPTIERNYVELTTTSSPDTVTLTVYGKMQPPEGTRVKVINHKRYVDIIQPSGSSFYQAQYKAMMRKIVEWCVWDNVNVYIKNFTVTVPDGVTLFCGDCKTGLTDLVVLSDDGVPLCTGCLIEGLEYGG